MSRRPEPAHERVGAALRSAGLEPVASTPERWRKDYSIFQLAPAAVVRPSSEEDVAAAIAVARDCRIPAVVRGGGSNTGGAAITTGILIVLDAGSIARLSYNESDGTVTAQPGARHDQVQALLRAHGRWLPSDPSSGPLSCIGGNIATRASGPHALRHGAIHRYIREVRLVLADGSVIDTRDRATVQGVLTQGLASLAEEIASNPPLCSELEARRRTKWATGYELLALLDNKDDPIRAIPRLVTGAMGTLGVVTEAVLDSSPRPGGLAAALLRFASTADACRAAAVLREHAAAIEIVSRSALRILAEQTDVLGDAGGGSLLIAEWSGSHADDASRELEALAGTGLWTVPAGGMTIARDEREIESVWKARKALLPVIRRLAGSERAAYSVVNDVGVSPDRLAEVIETLERIFDDRGLAAPVYGHAGNGNLHLRPLLPIGDTRLAWELAEEVYDAVADRGGCISPEHGLGRLRAPFLAKEWSEAALGSMRRLKQLFDPTDLLNPGVVFHQANAEHTGKHGWSVDPVLA